MKIVLLGADGQLGNSLRVFLSKKFRIYSFNKSELNITNHYKTSKIIKSVKPDIIINASAYTLVDKAESQKNLAYSVNYKAVNNLSNISKKLNAWLIHYSTDYVFDGNKKKPYEENDPPNPINIYGDSKLQGEKAIVKKNVKYLIFRTSWVVGKEGNNFVKKILNLGLKEKSLKIVNDQTGVPSSTVLISKITIKVINLIKKNKPLPKGIYNLTPSGSTNWYNMARIIVKLAKKEKIPLKLNETNILPTKTNKFITVAKRPLNSLLNTKKLRNELSFNIPHWKKDFMMLSRQIIKKYEKT